MDSKKEISETIDTFLSVFGNRWNLLILNELFNGPKRFNELKNDLAPITQTVLIRHLRTLEEHNVIRKTEQPGPVPAVYYTFTAEGYTMIPSMVSMYNWLKDNSV